MTRITVKVKLSEQEARPVRDGQQDLARATGTAQHPLAAASPASERSSAPAVRAAAPRPSGGPAEPPQAADQARARAERAWSQPTPAAPGRGLRVPRSDAAARAGRKPPRWLARRGPLAWAAGMLLLCMLIPALLVQRQHPVTDEVIVRQPKPTPAPPIQEAVPQEPLVHVYLTKEQAVEKVTLEQYVRGVVAAEMPTEFEMEALKAQAIAARTFIVRRLADQDTSGVSVKGAEVTDTVAHQVYMSLDTLANPKNKEKLARVTQAVNETRGVILTYKGKPIEASFFSTSNGYTENSEEYWNGRIPYLRSVASPWDKAIAPHFTDTVSMPLTRFMNLLNIRQPAIPVSASTAKKQLALANAAEPRILSKTTGHRIKLIRIGGKNFSGREIREKLGLRSSEFTWRIHKGQIDITTYGNGHGVGMSQWGANGMAMEGATAEAIVKHYYTGVTLQQVDEVLHVK